MRPRRWWRLKPGLFPRASAAPTVRESQALELLAVLQSHGSQGPSHSFKYKGRTNALKGAGEMLATRKTCTAVRRGIAAVEKEELERQEFKIGGQK